jgi:phenylalanyl-tRNA synthetase alpha chain
MLSDIAALQDEALEQLADAVDADALEAWRIRYLGSKGSIKSLMGQIKDVPADQKKAFGQRANAARQTVEDAFQNRLTRNQGSAASTPTPAALEGIDLTEPGLPPRLGRRHVLTRTIDQLVDVFATMGFTVATGPEVEDEFHNFVALNIPDTHPARDPLDNFYLASFPKPGDPTESVPTRGLASLLRSQTSTVQIRTMESQEPPVRVISTGRVYRPDEHDATHFSMFHQVEGLYVDHNVSMVDLKTTLYQFARTMFGPDAEIMLVPSYFPFTEPSAELYVKMDLGRGTEWIEIGGCGMVDPAVFEQVGYDPDVWSGFAFGLGIERLAMRKYGIPDIRWLFENDLRFLRAV